LDTVGRLEGWQVERSERIKKRGWTWVGGDGIRYTRERIAWEGRPA